MFLKNSNQVVVTLLLFTTISNIYSKPIEVTGTNIKYYKLTPNEGSGSYDFDYGTKDGAERSERGFIKREPGSNRPLLVVTGTFKYPDSDGELHEVSYIADEDGYRIVSKEDVEAVHKQFPNEVIVTTSQPTVTSKLKPKPKISPTQPSFPIPKTESHLIKLKVIKPPPVKPIECPPGKCSGARESKIFNIKSLKFG